MSADCDVLVVGAGVHGCGAAQAAAAAGRSVLVLERSAPAAGTSSKSSKLIHGGLRYLETAQLALVRQGLAERRLLRTLAPGLVRLVPMHIPVYGATRRAPWQIHAGLVAYALLGGLRRDCRFQRLPRAAWAALDGLDTRGLRAVFRYHEAQTDDAALTRAILRSAGSLGARCLAPAEFVGAVPADGGLEVHYRDAAGEHTLRTRTLVNAAGPWASGVAARITGHPPPPAVELVQGSHVEYDGALAGGAYYVEAPRDGRAVFVLPHGERTLVGTTEVPYHGDPSATHPTDAERDYLQHTVAHYFPRFAGAPQAASWAGLRVLPAAPGAAFGRPRETVYAVDSPRRPRVVSIYGGKLTTWRLTAAAALARLAPSLPRTDHKARTDELPLG